MKRPKKDYADLLRVPSKYWQEFKKRCEPVGYSTIRGRDKGEYVILMSGVPVHIAENVLDQIEYDHLVTGEFESEA